jgi:type I restriction enzyme S subunit
MSWKKRSLGDLIKISKGRKHEPLVKGQYRYINIEDLHNPNNSVFANEAGNFVTESDLIIAWDGANAGKVGVGYQGVIGSTLAKLSIITKDIDPRFLFWAIESFNTLIKSQRTGATIPHINGAALKDLQIPLPPLPIQKRIAEILDAADALKRKDQELLKKYDELAQAIFIDMFGDPVKNEKGWEVKRLKDVCVKITDGTHFSPPSQIEGVPYITAKHLKQDFIDFYCNPTYINQKNHEEIFSRCTPVKGDVLYIKDGATTGIAAVNEYDFEFSMLSSLALIKPRKENLNSYFLSCYLNNNIVKKELIRSYMAGAAIKRFTLEKINKFEIMLPPIKLQNLFENRWKILRQNIFNLKNGKSDDLFNSLIQKAFKGELVA